MSGELVVVDLVVVQRRILDKSFYDVFCFLFIRDVGDQRLEVLKCLMLNQSIWPYVM